MIKFTEPLPAGTYEISFKAARISTTAVTSGWKPLYVIFNGVTSGTNGTDYKCYNDFYTKSDGTWYSYTATITSDSAITSFAFHGDWAQSGGEYALFDDITITPASQAINYITGTTATYYFEDKPTVDEWSSNAATISGTYTQAYLAANPNTVGNASSYVVKSTTNNNEWPQININLAKPLTAGNTYIVSFDSYKTNSDDTRDELWKPYSWDSYIIHNENKYVGEFILNKWFHKDVVIDITKDISSLKIHWRSKSGSTAEIAYFDNLRVDKAVQVTYKGTTDRVAYVKYADLFEPELTEEDKSNFIIGWALTENAPETEMITSYSTTSEVVFYPVYQRPVPETLNKYSIRFGEKNGLRFAAVVDLALRKSSATEEYGFLVTRKKLLQDKNASNDTLKVYNDGTGEVWDDISKTVGLTANEVVFVAGRAYQKSSGVDLIYDNAGGTKLDEESIKNGTAIGITVVLTNIPVKNYKDNFVVRPYVKIAGTYYYGEAKENSYYAVADAIKNNTDEYAKLTDDQKQEIEDILSDSSAS